MKRSLLHAAPRPPRLATHYQSRLVLWRSHQWGHSHHRGAPSRLGEASRRRNPLRGHHHGARQPGARGARGSE